MDKQRLLELAGVPLSESANKINKALGMIQKGLDALYDAVEQEEDGDEEAARIRMADYIDDMRREYE